MDWHVQRLALPAPGSASELHALVAKLHEPMLERDRPGWRIFVIDGLERDRFAVFIKVHHALVDGESGMELLQRSLSHSPRDRRIRSIVATSLPVPREQASASQPPEPEDEFSVIARKAVAIGLGALRLAEETFAGFRGPSEGEARSFAAPHTPMNEPIRSERSVSHVMLPLDAMKARRSHLGRDAERRGVVRARCGHEPLSARNGQGTFAAAGGDLPGLAAGARRQAGIYAGVHVLDAARRSGGDAGAAHAGGDEEHGRCEAADPVAPQGRGIRLLGAVVRDGRNARPCAAAPAGFPAGVERARLERAWPGRAAVPGRRASRGALPGVDAHFRHGSQYHFHVVRGAGAGRLHAPTPRRCRKRIASGATRGMLSARWSGSHAQWAAAVRRNVAGRAPPSEAGDQRKVPATLLEFALPTVPDPVMQCAALRIQPVLA